jgi:transcription initiation factor TFIIB
VFFSAQGGAALLSTQLNMDVLIDRAWSDFASLRGTLDVPAVRGTASEFLCEFCGGPKVFDGVEIDLPVCRDCGRVDESYICEEPEWRSGGDGETADPSRVGAPVNTDHFSAAWGQTTYMTVNRAASYATKRLARINMHASMNHKDRALFHAYAELDRIGKGELGLTEAVMYSAKIKYKAFNEAVLTRGAVRNGIKANCVFQACREAGVARTTQEIADAFGIPARDLSRTFDMYQEQVPETVVHVTTPADLVSRFFNEVTGIPDEDYFQVQVARGQCGAYGSNTQSYCVCSYGLRLEGGSGSAFTGRTL